MTCDVIPNAWLLDIFTLTLKFAVVSILIVEIFSPFKKEKLHGSGHNTSDIVVDHFNNCVHIYISVFLFQIYHSMFVITLWYKLLRAFQNNNNHLPICSLCIHIFNPNTTSLFVSQQGGRGDRPKCYFGAQNSNPVHSNGYLSIYLSITISFKVHKRALPT